MMYPRDVLRRHFGRGLPMRAVPEAQASTAFRRCPGADDLIVSLPSLETGLAVHARARHSVVDQQYDGQANDRVQMFEPVTRLDPKRLNKTPPTSANNSERYVELSKILLLVKPAIRPSTIRLKMLIVNCHASTSCQPFDFNYPSKLQCLTQAGSVDLHQCSSIKLWVN
jgi:hypothetical protein